MLVCRWKAAQRRFREGGREGDGMLGLVLWWFCGRSHSVTPRDFVRKVIRLALLTRQYKR